MPHVSYFSSSFSLRLKIAFCFSVLALLCSDAANSKRTSVWRQKSSFSGALENLLSRSVYHARERKANQQDYDDARAQRLLADNLVLRRIQRQPCQRNRGPSGSFPKRDVLLSISIHVTDVLMTRLEYLTNVFLFEEMHE